MHRTGRAGQPYAHSGSVRQLAGGEALEEELPDELVGPVGPVGPVGSSGWSGSGATDQTLPCAVTDHTPSAATRSTATVRPQTTAVISAVSRAGAAFGAGEGTCWT